MNDKLEKWRKKIDFVDEKILALLAKRMSIVSKIGKLKKKQKVSALDKSRWEQVLKSSLKKGETLGLSKDLIKALFSLIS